MANVNTISTVGGVLKPRFADALSRLIPEEYVIQNLVSFNRKKKLGSQYEQPAVLQREQGVTYAKSGAGAYHLDAPIAGMVKTATVQGSQCTIRSAIDYETLAKGDQQGEAAYEETENVILENQALTVRHRLECSLWYGQDELGLVSGVAGAVITITTAEWASGIWSGQEEAKLEIFDAAGTTFRGECSIVSVNITTREVTVDAVPAGTVATDRIFFKTAHTTADENDMAGIHKILTNTGTLFGISASTYSLWKSCSLSAGDANLSFETCQDGGALLLAKGGKGEYWLFVSPTTWAKMMTDQAALRRHGDPNKSTEYAMGAEKITYFWQGGKINIVSSILVKEGYAYMLQPKLFTRIGATDVTFKTPGRNETMRRELSDQAGQEVRAYYHEAIFTKAPGKACLITNIVNT